MDNELAKKIAAKFLQYFKYDENGTPTIGREDDFGQIDSLEEALLKDIWNMVKDQAPETDEN